jgi:hypothetical protein
VTMVADARAALLDGLLDYAGLFPPASLDLPAAMAAYRAHLHDPAARLLRRFIVPARRLAELAPWLDLPGAEGPLRLAVLASAADAATVREFSAGQPRVVVESVEARLPSASAIEDLACAFAEFSLCVEAEAADGDPDPDTAFIRSLARHAPRVGYKLRCGGLSPAQIPSATRVARVAATCRDARVSLKLTAGLHHPVRGMGKLGSAPMHGFLNVVGASLLAWSADLGLAELAQVVAETDPRAFSLDEAAFAWREHRIDAARIAELRQTAITGLGSCSFEEPRDDLRALGMLPWTSTS